MADSLQASQLFGGHERIKQNLLKAVLDHDNEEATPYSHFQDNDADDKDDVEVDLDQVEGEEN